MNYTSLNIGKQDFNTEKKGFNKNEVNLFITNLQKDYDEFEEKILLLEEELKKINIKLSEYEKIEENLRNALLSLNETEKETLEKVKNQASQILIEAKLKSEEIINNAEEEAKSTRDTLLFLKEQRDILLIRLKNIIKTHDGMLNDFMNDRSTDNLQKSLAEAAALKAKAELNIDSILEKLL